MDESHNVLNIQVKDMVRDFNGGLNQVQLKETLLKQVPQIKQKIELLEQKNMNRLHQIEHKIEASDYESFASVGTKDGYFHELLSR
jgi:hypothetical protein